MAETERRTDFYTLFHKGLRKRLFEAVVAAGATDVADPAAGRALGLQLAALFDLLALHALVEETYVHPFFRAVAPALLARLEAEHGQHETEVNALRAEAARVTQVGDASAGLSLYRALARFVGHYLAHLDDEEAALPRLWAEVDERALGQAFGEFQRSRTPEQLTAAWELMLPALTPAERMSMALAIKAAAPEAVVARFRAAAHASLDLTQLTALAAHLDGARPQG